MKRIPLRRKTPLRRKPWRRALGTPEQRLAFKREVLALDEWSCIAEGRSRCEGELQAAHVIPKQRLRRQGFGAEVVYASGSAMTLCEGHHRRHDAGYERIGWEQLPERCRTFVSAHGLHFLLREAA